MTRFIVISQEDPVAQAVAEGFGPLPAGDRHVDGAPIRRLNGQTWLLRRPGLHIRDEHLDRRLGGEVEDPPATLIFPSLHRSQSGSACLTVHPIGNLTDSAPLGGEPRTPVPTDPRLMAAALRQAERLARTEGIGASYEATHHGPALDTPAFFLEISETVALPARGRLARGLCEILRDLTVDPSDRVALGIGGGHYAPHFTELAVQRHWAFGHIVSRHALGLAGPEVLESAFRRSPDAQGFLAHRASDVEWAAGARIGRRFTDGEGGARRNDAILR